MSGLAPATNYWFKIAPFIIDYGSGSADDGGVEGVDGVGPDATVYIRTSGKALPKPLITNAMITKSSNAIKLTWQFNEDEKRKGQDWTFGIFYGLKQVRECDTYMFLLI